MIRSGNFFSPSSKGAYILMGKLYKLSKEKKIRSYFCGKHSLNVYGFFFRFMTFSFSVARANYYTSFPFFLFYCFEDRFSSICYSVWFTFLKSIPILDDIKHDFVHNVIFFNLFQLVYIMGTNKIQYCRKKRSVYNIYECLPHKTDQLWKK